MGYYTEFTFSAVLKKDTSKEILEILDKAVNNPLEYYEELTGKEMPSIMSATDYPNLPIEHEFGKTSRWYRVLYGNYNKETRKLKLNTDINYGYTEIEEFLDWILPFIQNRRLVRCLGYKLPEDKREREYVYIYYNQQTKKNSLKKY